MTFWQMAYKYNWITLAQLKEAVKYNCIANTDYKNITGEDYVAETTAIIT